MRKSISVSTCFAPGPNNSHRWIIRWRKHLRPVGSCKRSARLREFWGHELEKEYVSSRGCFKLTVWAYSGHSTIKQKIAFLWKVSDQFSLYIAFSLLFVCSTNSLFTTAQYSDEPPSEVLKRGPCAKLSDVDVAAALVAREVTLFCFPYTPINLIFPWTEPISITKP